MCRRSSLLVCSIDAFEYDLSDAVEGSPTTDDQCDDLDNDCDGTRPTKTMSPTWWLRARRVWANVPRATACSSCSIDGAEYDLSDAVEPTARRPRRATVWTTTATVLGRRRLCRTRVAASQCSGSTASASATARPTSCTGARVVCRRHGHSADDRGATVWTTTATVSSDDEYVPDSGVSCR